MPDKPITSQRFSVRYHLQGDEAIARVRAGALCFEQTVELPAELVPADILNAGIVGKLESLARLDTGHCEAIISYSSSLLGEDISNLLNVTYGMASLRPGVRVMHLDLPDAVLKKWPGPQVGRAGLRDRVGIVGRPLLCGVLKPVGLPLEALAKRAYAMAKGGLDLIKDDQGLMDQPISPFDERVMRCADAVAKANQETGRNCLYIPHVTGSAKGMYKRSVRAKKAGAGGLLLCPGLTGFDAVRIIAQDTELNLPVMTHPAMLGSLYVNRESGMAPAVLFGQLPRLAGADVSIYPTYTKDYPMTKENCRTIAEETCRPWGHVKSTFPTAAGGMTKEHIQETHDLYGNDVVIIVGGEFMNSEGELTAVCQEFIEKLIR